MPRLKLNIVCYSWISEKDKFYVYLLWTFFIIYTDEQECRNASAERVLLEGQLDKLEKEVDVVRNAAKDDRQSSDKIMRENRQLHIQLHEHIRNEFSTLY